MQHDRLSVQVMRCSVVESVHSIKVVIVSSSGEVLESWGDVDTLVYPHNAIKAML
ncbi:asparaginase [Marinomonas spartinae]|uniref:asparaginase n=1 Tax=Marinomonas spartinae TaxID=1792290 RepID=UPI0018F166E2|nr:asparaginase [Marinomonas spartinae]MBJ7556169.1 asparaginase [Marinomonas spartinae]